MSTPGLCAGCPYRADGTAYVGPTERPGARLLILGEAPGADEVREGGPFAGSAGVQLDRFLQGAGLTRDVAHITNVVKCRPTANRRPCREARQACEPTLRDEIERVDPAVILCLGVTAARAMLGSGAKIGEQRGRAHLIAGRQVIVSYHPSLLSLNRAPERRGHVAEDIRLVAGLVAAASV